MGISITVLKTKCWWKRCTTWTSPSFLLLLLPVVQQCASWRHAGPKHIHENKSQGWCTWDSPILVKMTSTETLTESEAATQNSLPFYPAEVVSLFPNERGVGFRTDFAGFQLVENFCVVSFGKLLWRKSWWAITTVVQNRIRQRREIKGWGCSHSQRKATLFPLSSLPLLKHWLCLWNISTLFIRRVERHTILWSPEEVVQSLWDESRATCLALKKPLADRTLQVLEDASFKTLASPKERSRLRFTGIITPML